MPLRSGSDTRLTETFHSIVSHNLNKNIVVLNSQSRKKFRPKLAKPTPKCSVSVASSVAPTGKRQHTNQDSALVATQPPQPPLPLPRLIQNKKMKSSILDNYQSQFGTGQPITTANLGTSIKHPFLPPSQFHLMRNCSMQPEN